MAANNYNAETAWNYLGTGLFSGRGAHDYSSVSALKPRSRNRNTSNTGLIDPTQIINTYFSNINNYPEAALNSALAGKYWNPF